MIKSIPLSEWFNDQLDWSIIAKNTENASWDIIWKIVDKAYLLFINEFKRKYPQRLATINDLAWQILDNWGKLTTAKKLSLFNDWDGRSVVLTPELFMKAFFEVVESKAVVNAMRQQVLFYREVDEKLKEAFNKWV